jgi:hypothetical protein
MRSYETIVYYRVPDFAILATTRLSVEGQPPMEHLPTTQASKEICASKGPMITDLCDASSLLHN